MADEDAVISHRASLGQEAPLGTHRLEQPTCLCVLPSDLCQPGWGKAWCPCFVQIFCSQHLTIDTVELGDASRALIAPSPQSCRVLPLVKGPWPHGCRHPPLPPWHEGGSHLLQPSSMPRAIQASFSQCSAKSKAPYPQFPAKESFPLSDKS